MTTANDLDWTKLGNTLRRAAEDAHEGSLWRHVPGVESVYSFLLDNPECFGEDEWPADMPQEPNIELIAAYLNPDWVA